VRVQDHVIFNAISVSLELVLGMGMALLMHAAFRGRALMRAVVLVPWAILTRGTALTVVAPDSGFLNQILQALHLSRCAYRSWRCCRCWPGFR